MTIVKENLKKLLESKTDSLKLKSIRSAVWSAIGKGSGHFIRIAGNLILTRILFPEAFGLMATANVVLLVVQLFADSGVQIAIIQNPRGDEPRYLNTAWIISIIRGLLLGVIIISLAWPLSYLYKQPDLRFILTIMGVAPLISGFENPALPLLIKKFKVYRQVGMELTTQCVGLITTIILAVLMKSVDALAIGFTISALFRLFASYQAFPYRPALRWNKVAGRELFHFGKYVYLNTLITAAVIHMDVLVIGKFLDMVSLSFYNIGKNLGTMVLMFCVSVVSQSYMPAVSSVQKDIERVQRIYQRTVSFFLMLGIPVSIVLILFSSDIIRLLYDPRYQLSYISLFWYALAGIFRIISNISGSTFFAIGKPSLETISMAVGLLLVMVLLPLGLTYAQLFGASCSMAVALSLISVVECSLLVGHARFSLKIIVRPWGQAIFTSGVCIGLFFLLRPWLSSERLFNIPFMIVMGLLSRVVFAGVYQYMQGRNAFRGYSEGPVSHPPYTTDKLETVET